MFKSLILNPLAKLRNGTTEWEALQNQHRVDSTKGAKSQN